MSRVLSGSDEGASASHTPPHPGPGSLYRPTRAAPPLRPGRVARGPELWRRRRGGAKTELTSGMSVFLRAEWRDLVMINYEVDSALLRPLVPSGTEIDSWSGRTFVSLVGFLFLDTRVFGLPVPLHVNFEEVNLRFYVRRKSEEGWRRGVVFVKEIVPRASVAFLARHLYGENYVHLRMRHRSE